jgi:cysteinyl-tRNA synthetase
MPSEYEIEQLIEQRNQARKVNNFQLADQIRDGLKARGVVLMDEKGVKGDFSGQEVTGWRYWNDTGPPTETVSPGHGIRPSEHEILQLIEERNAARRAGDYAKSDAIRKDLHARGVVLMDEKGQLLTTWRYWDDQAPP